MLTTRPTRVTTPQPPPTPPPPDKMAAIFADDIFQRNFVNDTFCIWFEFHWSLFIRVQLTISQHWFRWWLGADQATSLYLNQCRPIPLRIYNVCDTTLPWVNLVVNSEIWPHQNNLLLIGEPPFPTKGDRWFPDILSQNRTRYFWRMWGALNEMNGSFSVI